MSKRAVATLGLGLVVLAGGCAPDTYFPPSDFERAGTWQAEGINDRNLRAMVVDPSHLQNGVAAPTDRGQQGAAAVTALQQGQRPPLPRGLSNVGSGGSTAAGVSSGGSGGRN